MGESFEIIAVLINARNIFKILENVDRPPLENSKIRGKIEWTGRRKRKMGRRGHTNSSIQDVVQQQGRRDVRSRSGRRILEAGKAGIPCGENRFLRRRRTIEMKKESRRRRWRWWIERRRGRRSLGFSADRDSTDKSASLAASVIAIVPTKGDKSPRLKPFPDSCVHVTTSGYVVRHDWRSARDRVFSPSLSSPIFAFLDSRNLLRIAIGIHPFNRGVTRATYIEKIGNGFLNETLI